MGRADLIALAVAAVIGLAMLASGALAADDPPHIERVAAAAGALSMSNTREGAAIFTASDLHPGDTISGTLTLGNTGDQAGQLLLSRALLQETPGTFGGRLSDVLTLRVEDITSGTAHEVVSGELGGLQNVLLKDLPGGARRTYRFVVGFPDSGRGGADNAYMGGSLRVDYEWLTEAIPAPDPTPTITATPAPGGNGRGSGTGGAAPPAPAPAPVPAPGRSSALAPRLFLQIPHQRVVHSAYVRVLARCSERCRVRFSGRAKTAPRGRAARALVLLRRGLFKGERRGRSVRVTRRGAIRLRLTPRGRGVLRRALDAQGRVAVVIRARVRGSRGTRYVKKRIVLHTTLVRNGKRISFR